MKDSRTIDLANCASRGGGKSTRLPRVQRAWRQLQPASLRCDETARPVALIQHRGALATGRCHLRYRFESTCTPLRKSLSIHQLDRGIETSYPWHFPWSAGVHKRPEVFGSRSNCEPQTVDSAARSSRRYGNRQSSDSNDLAIWAVWATSDVGSRCRDP